MTDDEFAARMKETKHILDSVKENLLLLKPNNKDVNNDVIKEIVNNIKNNWPVLPSGEKKRFMSMFIENIKIDKKKELRKY